MALMGGSPSQRGAKTRTGLFRDAVVSRTLLCVCIAALMLFAVPALADEQATEATTTPAVIAAPGISEQEAVRLAEQTLISSGLYMPEEIDGLHTDVVSGDVASAPYWIVTFVGHDNAMTDRVVISAESGRVNADREVLQALDAWDPYVKREGAVGSWLDAVIGLVTAVATSIGLYFWFRKPRIGWSSWIANISLSLYTLFVLLGVFLSADIGDTRGLIVTGVALAMVTAASILGFARRGRWGLVEMPAAGAATQSSAMAPETNATPRESTSGSSADGQPTQQTRDTLRKPTSSESTPLTVTAPEDLPCFSNVGGMDDLKDQLRESVGLLVAHGDLAREYRIDWNGVLLYGPPGVGKTFIAKATAGEFGLNFIDIRVSDVIGSTFGSSPKLISQVFQAAAKHRPCILFFDEFDSIAQRREQALFDTENIRVVNQLLRELEAVRSVPDLIVMAATNHKDTLDEAITRPGRFDRHIAIGLPDEGARRQIFKAQLSGRPLASDIDIEELVCRTDGLSGADITALVNTAALDALKKSVQRRSGAAIPTVESDPPTEPARTSEPLSHALILDALEMIRAKTRPSMQPASWDDLVLDEATRDKLLEVQRCVEDFEELKLRGIEIPRGILLYGPPGTGKTTIARVLASQAKASFFAVKADEIVSMWLGETEKQIARLFSEARKHRPSIIFIDEIDTLVAKRVGGTWSAERTNQFLTEIDGVMSTPGVFVIGATNFSESLDPALLRGGRLSRQILIPLPDADCRVRLFRVHSRNMPLAADVDLAELGRLTDTLSGADIRDICQAAGLRVVKRAGTEVTMSDLVGALDAYRNDRTKSTQRDSDMDGVAARKIPIGFAPPTVQRSGGPVTPLTDSDRTDVAGHVADPEQADATTHDQDGT